MNGDPDPLVHTLVYVNTNYVYYNVQTSLSGGALHAPYEWRRLAGSQRCSRNEKRSTFFYLFTYIPVDFHVQYVTLYEDLELLAFLLLILSCFNLKFKVHFLFFLMTLMNQLRLF
jgi:hypothetical protein